MAINVSRIRQILQRLAARIVEIRERPPSEVDFVQGFDRGLPTIQWGVVVDPEIVEARFKALDEITQISDESGIWGQSSVDDAVWDFTRSILDLIDKDEKSSISSAITKAAEAFGREPTIWVVAILVYGIDPACEGTRFGKVLFCSREC